MTKLSNAGTANAAGSKPITEFGHATLTRRKTSKNCAGPARAAAAQGNVLPAKFRRNTNGNTANTAKKIRYQTSGVCGDKLELETANRWKCQAHSTANAPANPTRGSQSSKR